MLRSCWGLAIFECRDTIEIVTRASTERRMRSLVWEFELMMGSAVSVGFGAQQLACSNGWRLAMINGTSAAAPTLPRQVRHRLPGARAVKLHWHTRLPVQHPSSGRPVKQQYANAGPDCYWEVTSLVQID